MKRICFLLALILLCLPLFACSGAGEPVPLRIVFFDVGQGDSILLETPEGCILIDAGTDASEEYLCFRLSALGVTELRLAVFTHPDEDHIGGADGVLRRFPAREVWVGGTMAGSECADRLLAQAQESGAVVTQASSGTFFRLGCVTATVLSPSVPTGDDNNDSLILKVNCGDFDALFLGDAGLAAERELVRLCGASQLSCDLLKAGHHGSESSTGEELLRAAAPKYAVISCGAGNPYGHPHGAVLERLRQAGTTVLRTDLDGEIVFETDGKELKRVEK